MQRDGAFPSQLTQQRGAFKVRQALAGLALSIPGDPGGAVLTGTSENSLLHENSRTPAVTSIQMLVPKRVRLIIGFTQTVLA